MGNAYETLHSETVYKGLIFDVRRDRVRLPDGNVGERELVVHPGGAATLPVDDEGNVYLVRQHRQAHAGLMLEIPAGMLEPGEDAARCAARELGEEVGLTARELRLVASYYSLVGFCTERTHLFIAKGLSPCPRNLDPEEFIDVEKYTVEAALQMVRDGILTDGKTILALLAYQSGLY